MRHVIGDRVPLACGAVGTVIAHDGASVTLRYAARGGETVTRRDAATLDDALCSAVRAVDGRERRSSAALQWRFAHGDESIAVVDVLIAIMQEEGA